MIHVKSEKEIDLMREPCKIVRDTLDFVGSKIKAGMSTKEVDELVERYIRASGANPSCLGYGGFPASACISVNEMVVHGIPDERILKEGDIIAIDIGACYKGYHGDSAWTYAVGKISDEDQLLMQVTHDSLFKGLEAVRNGAHLGDVSAAIGDYIESFGFGIVEDFTGHGVGRDLHEDPAIFNFGVKGTGPILRSGMVLAIEPMVNRGTKRVKILSDRWTTVTKDKSNSAHYEHTIVVRDEGYEILTKL